ncbi:MAG: bifunctional pyr operon transcriptional regulator/uracil phosphoribosyltransferase PyrR [Clostridia bacterium]|jgi:Pyrimidine operon attenuation protein/uracil phosphoribosyltransferase|nr:bifunctional pyr operon transcriptional regulator/uracil phosphoribosyltransferase PyrR [Clostridia bacterium]
MKNRIMDETAVHRALARMTHEIIERNNGAEQLCLLGVRRRGIPLAKLLAENIARFEGVEIPVGTLDITPHRDDLSPIDKADLQGECAFPCPVEDKTVVIVDDVLYTGRSARAAIEAVFAFGRPQKLQLAILIDRGHRELPIRADYVGKNIPTSREETVEVCLPEYDGETAVYICKNEPESGLPH